MKKPLLSILIAALCIVTFAFVGCGTTGGNEQSDTVTVNFVIDGTIAETQTVKKGETFDLPSCSTDKEGHRFLGWKRPDGTLANWNYVSERTANEDLTFTAVYTANSYTVSFYCMGSKVGATQTVKYGEEFVSPDDEVVLPSIASLVGWKLRGGNGDIVTDKTVKDNAVYDAVIAVESYTSITVEGFNTDFGINDKYSAGDNAKVKINLADGTVYEVKNDEYEVVVPEDFGSRAITYEIKVKIKFIEGEEQSFTASVRKNRKKLSVLFIGNSYSDDTIDQAYKVAKSAGIETIEIADLYYAGCTIEQHLNFAKGNSSQYIFRYFDDAGNINVPTLTQTGVPLSTMEYGIKFKAWDYIVLQQGSHESGNATAYNGLSDLIEYVKNAATNPDVRFAFNMTWAYRAGSSNKNFWRYNNSQKEMYNGIVSAVKTRVETNGEIAAVIPNGTAIQNVRTSIVGDSYEITRDDNDHLSQGLGRYIAALTFVSRMSGINVDDISYAPSSLSADRVLIAKESVKNAIISPYAVTKSQYAGASEEDIAGKTVKTITFRKGYYNSADGSNYTSPITTAGNSDQYYCTDKFTKADLPVGSVIYIATGWQYRPEGWINGNKNTVCPDVSTVEYVKITEQWWGNYTERAFNISKSGSPAIWDDSPDLSIVFKIYV